MVVINIITTLDIVRAVAIQIKDKFDAKICIDKKQLQKYANTNNCIYIEATTLTSEVATLFANKDSIIVDISYYPHTNISKESLYEVEVKIRSLFVRSIKVANTFLHVDTVVPDVTEDEVGWRLNVSLITKLFNNMYVTTISEYDGKKVAGTDKIEILDTTDLMDSIDLEVKNRKVIK